MNKVIISPNELNSAPVPDIMKLYIDGLSKNLYEKFLLCGMMIDSNKNISYLPTTSLKNQDFFIVTNINPTFDESAQANIIQIVKKVLFKTSSALNGVLLSEDDLSLKLTTDSQNMFVLDTQNSLDDIQAFNPIMYD